MKSLLAVIVALTLTGCQMPQGDIVPASSVGQVRAIGGTVGYYRASNQVSAESLAVERRLAKEKANPNRQLSAMELDMIGQNKHELEEIKRMRKTQKERTCTAQAAAVNDQIRLTDFANGGLSYNEHKQRMEQLKSLQNHIYNKCMSN